MVHSCRKYQQSAETAALLGHPIAPGACIVAPILSAVRNQRCAVGEIAASLGLSQQIVSHHLKVLLTPGRVTGSRSGTRHLFAVRVEGLAVGKGFIDDFWPERLSALKRAVETSARSNDG